MSISIAILKYVKRVIRSIGLSQGRQTHRERSRLVRDRTAHIDRMKGLLFAQGIRGINVKSQYKTLAADELMTGDGHRLPPRLACQIGRELQGLAMVQEQIADLRASLSQSGLRGNPSFAKCGRIADPTIG